MKLIDAYNLLVEDGITDNHRYFAEVYKLYGFTDEKSLKEYLDFIDHEPVAWMRGFPAKLATRLAFAKPKTAIIKLLKKQSVVQALGADYITRIHDKVWSTFKNNVDSLMVTRNPHEKKEAKDMEEASVGSAETLDTIETLPTPPLQPYKSFGPAQPTECNEYELLPITHDSYTPQDRVEFLKEVLLKMADELPAGHAAAFRLLVSRVP